MGKNHANKGVERNKTPLQNIVYNVEVVQNFKTPLTPEQLEKYDKYKFKEEGYLILSWGYQKQLNVRRSMNYHGFITPEKLKEKIGSSQWGKFCQGKREFIIQRRIDGKNIKKK